jgi:hypothetical protein
MVELARAMPEDRSHNVARSADLPLRVGEVDALTPSAGQ